MPLAVYGAATGAINGKLYVAGGQADPLHGNNVATLQIYDPASDTWTTGASLPQAGAAANAGVIGGKLYVAGGGPPSNIGETNTVVVYDPVADTWSNLAAMPNPPAWAGTAVINGILYVVGGLVPGPNIYTGVATNTVQSYNPVTDTWTTLAPMPTPRYLLVAGAIDGILYAAGGTDNTNTFATVESYNPATNTWASEPSMPAATYLPAAGVIGHTFYLAGGNTLHNQLVNAVQAFTLTTTCQMTSFLTKVNLFMTHGRFSLSGQPTAMEAEFRPSDGLEHAASDCGFARFNWQQTIDFLPSPSPFTLAARPDLPALTAPPAFLDPPLGGYPYAPVKGTKAFPYYYALDDNDPFPLKPHENGGTFLSFADAPFDPLLIFVPLPSRYMAFTTRLVGVLPGGVVGPTLYQWKWKTNLNGLFGGVSQTASDIPVDAGSGTGGITITETNGVPTSLPPPSANTYPANTSCASSMSGTFLGDVSVPENASCKLSIANVKGNIQVGQNASLLVASSVVTGNVHADHCASVRLASTFALADNVYLSDSVSIAGNFEIQHCVMQSGYDGPDIKIGGNFECHNNSGPCIARNGEVGGNVHVHNNSPSSPSDISLNTIKGNLQCEHDSPAPIHTLGPNIVEGNASGQCAASLGF